MLAIHKSSADDDLAATERKPVADRDLLWYVDNKVGATTISKYEYGLDDLGRRKSVIKTGSELGSAAHFDLYGYNDRSELEAGRAKKLIKAADLLDDWPVDRPGGWLRTVNRPQDGKELDRVRDCVRRGRPYGDEAWTARTAATLGLESTLRSVGRPRNDKEV